MNGQSGFFDLVNRLEQLSHQGDPLERLNNVVDWKIFMPLINRAFDKAKKSPSGRKPYHGSRTFSAAKRVKSTRKQH